MEEWLSEVDRYASESTIKLLVGNKADLVDEKQVSDETAQVFYLVLNFLFRLLSCALGDTNSRWSVPCARTALCGQVGNSLSRNVRENSYKCRKCFLDHGEGTYQITVRLYSHAMPLQPWPNAHPGCCCRDKNGSANPTDTVDVNGGKGGGKGCC